jgi:hypothetical protein
MTTKVDLIAQCKAENPKIISTINGEEIELTGAEYDKACNDWAEMRLIQIAKEAEDAAEQTTKEAAQAKLLALGLTESDLITMGLLPKPEVQHSNNPTGGN